MIASRTCFVPMITQDSLYMVSLFRHYKNGNLLVSGGIIDQPAVYLEAMEAIGQLHG